MHSIEDDESVTSEMPSEMVEGTIDDKEGLYAYAAFNSFFFNIKDQELDVNIVHPQTGELVYTTRVNDYITPDMDDSESNMTLMLLIEFLGNTEVSVSIPEWDTIDVGHGMTF